LLDLTEEELSDYTKKNNLPAFRAKQIRKWIFEGALFDEMTNLPISLRDSLSKISHTGLLKIEQKLQSELDETCKYLFNLGDGNMIESVLMKYKYGYSVCISSQAGCRMMCSFCASSKLGFSRNLSVGEMLSQIITINKDKNIRIGNVVIMGIGEPMDNYDNVIKFLHEAQNPTGLGISYRRISLSTCGVVPGIEKLMIEDLPITLSVSLHSPFNEQRSQMMPINNKYDIAQLIGACKRYIQKTGRRITFEYAMIAGVNDTPSHAMHIMELIQGMLCHVNLIPVNSVKGIDYTRSSKKDLEIFTNILQGKGIEVTVRRELGRDIAAACGQLRRQSKEESV